MVKSIVNISIVDSGKDKYLLKPQPITLGRQYENNATEIQITRPETETDTDCFLVATDQYGTIIDHIQITDNKYIVTTNLSQYKRVFVGFYFSGENDYIKGSEVVPCDFLPAQKPSDFVATEPEQKKNMSYLVDYGFVDSKLVGNELQFFNASGNKVVSFDLSPFTQEQSDWAETDTTKETYIKNKPTLSKVASSGDYNDLTNKPATTTATSVTKTSQLENDSDFVVASEENTFTAKQNFNVETEFNGVAEHNADINVNDSTLNVVDTTNDTVTKYGATSIKIGNNEVKLPSSSGQLVLSDDLNKVDDKSNYYFAGAVPTTDDKFSIVGGSNAKSNGTGNIVYGARTEGSADRINDDGTTDYAQSIVIGNYSSSNGINTQVLGDNARAEADNATQIGQGTNYIANSVQFGDDNIYKKDTHALTVNNAQVNGNDVYGVIKGEGVPTTATAGKIGQVYQDTTNDKRYFCTYSADTYGWQEIQNKMTQSLTSLADGSEVIVSGDVLMQRKIYVGAKGIVTFTFGIKFDNAFLPIVTNATFVNLTDSAITVNVGDTAQNIVIGAIGIKYN